MARHTEDREDLLRDATALVPRVMLQVEIEERTVEVFAGFRNGEALSLYFDSDPVFHFNSAGHLRRAFADGHILKASQGRLVSWSPQRTESRVTMASEELTTEKQEQLGKRMLALLCKLKSAMARQQFTLMGQVSADGDGLERLSSWLESHSGFTIAELPNVS